VPDDRVRIELAFDGGQGLSAYVSADAADAIERALHEGREDALTLDTEDGRTTIPLKRIVYVKRYARESRVGFGATS
jgi:hypothetical protein